MPRVALSIELTDAAFIGGDTVRGAVVVAAEAASDCAGLRIGLGWRTSGAGEPDAAEVEGEVLFTGSLEPGEHSFPFALSMPHGPLSHDGRLIQLGWAVTASAVLADREVTATAPVRLLAGPAAAVPPSVPNMPPLTAWQRPPGSITDRLLPTILGTGVAIIGGMVVLVGVVLLLAGGLPGLLVGAAGMAMIVLGSRHALRASGNMVARRRVRDITIRVSPTSLRPGQEFTVAVSFQPAQDTRIEQVRLRLILRELATTGTGADRATRSVDQVYASVQICGACAFSAEERFATEHTLALPPDAPLSFSATSNRLLWLVQLDIDIDDWPDLTEPHPILVY
jgi:hypothetical protein